MLSRRMILAFLAAAGMAAAENEPQTTLRSVVDGVSFQSSPATVARGGILAVIGEQLASAHTVAEGLPLPVSLDDPAVEVLINGVAAPLFFVSPDQINAQVPWEIVPGRAEVVVRRGGIDSTAMPVIVADVSPSLFRHDGSSAPIAQSVSEPEAPAAEPVGSLSIDLGSPGSTPTATGDVLDSSVAIASGDKIALFAAGVGGTTPAIAKGAAAAAGTSYSLDAAQRAHIGGIPVSNLSVDVSTDLVGVYKMTLTVPELAESTEVVHWGAGNQVAGGVLGPVEAPAARYMAMPDGVESVRRIDMPNLNPYYIAVSGTLDETEGCYSGVQLLDFRRDTATALSDCLLPSFPNAGNPEQDYRPFEVATNSPVLAALVAPATDPESGVTDQLLVVDSAAGTAETVALAQSVLRLQSGAQGSRDLRLERPDGTALRDIVDFSGAVVGESAGLAPLPAPLEVDDLTRLVAQGNANFAGGYRVRILGPESPDEISNSQAILFDRTAAVLAKVAFPGGWAPIAPPRRTDAAGALIGAASLAPATPGFAGERTAYVVARKTDGTQDGVVAFHVELSEDFETDPPVTVVSMTAAVTPFPSGSYAANCHTAVRWQRVPLTQTIAIAGSGEVLSEYAEPRDNELCTSDRLVLFDPQAAAIRSVSLPSPDDAPAKLDIASKGATNGYLYFGDGTRETAFQASQKIHVFDPVTEAFTEIDLPEGAGLPFNNLLTQQLAASGRLVALATGGATRTNAAGLLLPPFPGNRGLLVIDLPDGTATHLALPDGFQRAIQGNNRLVQDGRRMFGVIPLLGRAFGVFRRPTNAGGSAVMTWDVATGAATEIPLPEGGFSVVQPYTGAAEAPFIWDYNGKTASFAFGVLNEDGGVISIGIVGL